MADKKSVPDCVPISVAIPTYRREEVLTHTIAQFLEQRPRALELLVIDQTELHSPATMQQLELWNIQGQIRWLRLGQPSQPGALNHALLHATQAIVLFLDDDVEIVPGFVASHASHFHDASVWAVVGQVLQPGEVELTEFVHQPRTGPLTDLDFPFRSARPSSISNGMSGNLSVRRDKALALGGFDENFLPPVSYRFDSEFCKRLVRAGGRIRFEPRARIYHLRAERGGTRSTGSHMTSASPIHGVGDYYFALRQGLSVETVLYLIRRPFREIRTRFHLRNPWWIPVKLIGELRAFLLAVRLWKRGPRFIEDGHAPAGSATRASVD